MSKYTPEEMAQTLVRQALETFQSMSYPADQSLMVLSELFEKSFVLVINDYRSRITREREANVELERKLGISENCLALIKKNTRGFDWPPENNWRSDLIIQLGAWAEKALSEIDAKEGE